MAGFTIPDWTDAGVAEAQATWMQTDIDILTAGLAGTGVISGCAVTAQGTPDMTVAVAAGTIHSGTDQAVTAGNVTVGAAHASLNRIDLIYASSSAVKSIAAGTAAAVPGPPDLPAGAVALAFVYVPAADTDIDAIQIVDKRVILAPAVTGTSGSIGAKVYNSTTQTMNGSGTNSGTTLVTFDSEQFDTDGFHSTSSNTSRLTVPPGMGGKYLVSYHLWAGTGAPSTGAFAEIWKNNMAVVLYGTRTLNQVASAQTAWNNSVVLDLAAGDYVEVRVSNPHASTFTIGHASAPEVKTTFELVKLDAGQVGSGVGAAVYSASQTVVAGADTELAFDTERFDTDGFHSTSVNTSRMTIPTGLGGMYLVNAGCDLPSTPGSCYIQLYVNGVSVAETVQYGYTLTTSNRWFLRTTHVLQLAAGDYVEAKINRATGTSVSAGSMQLARIDAIPGGSWDGCILRNTAQTLTSGGNNLKTWNTQDRDTNNYWDPGDPTKVTVPATGWYRIDLQVYFPNAANGANWWQLLLNTTPTGKTHYKSPTSDTSTGVTVSFGINYATAGSYFQIDGWSNLTYGGAGFQTYLQVQRVS